MVREGLVSRPLVEPRRAPDLTPHRERSPELDPDLSPRLCTPVRVQRITRRTGLMRSQGCQASVSFTSALAGALVNTRGESPPMCLDTTEVRRPLVAIDDPASDHAVQEQEEKKYILCRAVR